MYDYIPHLIELRKVLLRCLLVVSVSFSFLFWMDADLYSLVAKPLLNALPIGGALIATEVTSPFMVPMKLAIVAAVFLTMPYILYEIWSFVAPGLYLQERKRLMPLIVSSATLFYLGMSFAYFVICPLALGFFAESAPRGVTVMTDIRHYLDFMLTVSFSAGLAFQVPIITFSLIRAGLVSVDQLSYFRPYIIVGAFILGMLLTPPDVVSQILLALPMWWLFEAGLFLAKQGLTKRQCLTKDNVD
jgi:sec-independent protein translocase protein TatC